MVTLVEKWVEKKELLLIFLASLWIGLCAQIKIPLGFTPVPLTCQTLAILGIGARLGSKKGAIAALFYLCEGILGLPVFAGGKWGILHVLGPTGGYLLAYPLEAFLMGKFLERGEKILAMFIPCALQLILGSLWLIPFVGIQKIFPMGFYPFIGLEIIKSTGVVVCESK